MFSKSIEQLFLSTMNFFLLILARNSLVKLISINLIFLNSFFNKLDTFFKSQKTVIFSFLSIKI